MALFFENLDAFIKDVKDYQKELSTPIVDENGEPKVVLIGIDGNPTEDDSVLGNRQKIFMHFEKLHEAYTGKFENPTIKEFHEMHTMALIQSGATFRRCEETFGSIFDEVTQKFKEIDKIKNDLLSGSLTDTKAIEAEMNAKLLINELYDLAYKMKLCYDGAFEQAISARLMNMVMGYVEKGRDFFNDSLYFEDTFTPCIEEMFKAFDSIRVKLRHNARCDSAKEMITVVN